MNYEQIIFDCALNRVDVCRPARDMAINSLIGAMGQNVQDDTKAAFMRAVDAYFFVLEDRIEIQIEKFRDKPSELSLEAASWLEGLLLEVKTIDPSLVTRLAGECWDYHHSEAK